MQGMNSFNQLKLIAEVKKRPALYSAEHPADRDEKMGLWREIGAAIYPDWSQCNKATAYDRILHIQRKWRSLRDAYTRELRSRKSGVRVNKCVYKFFKPLSFLGGFEGSSISDSGEPEDSATQENSIQDDTSTVEFDPLIISTTKQKPKRRKLKTPKIDECQDEEEMALSNLEMGENETDSDKLFMLSFVPEMKQLPVNIKMWARAQIANVMQEAVSRHYDYIDNTRDRNSLDMKMQRVENSE